MKENGGGICCMCSHIATTSAQGHLTFWQRPERKESVLFKTQMYLLVVLVNNMTLVLTTVSNLVFPSQG